MTVLSLMLVGCSIKEADLVGEWQGDVAGAAPGGGSPVMEMLAAHRDRVKLIIEAGGEMSIKAGTITVITGSWQFNDSEVTLTIMTVPGLAEGTDISQEIFTWVYKVESGGKELTLVSPEESGKAALGFTKG
ncbi:MAG: hypothetical protein IH851_00750 [Armatimonadetes bacterium]|nr:hypothetical protein [Armatimonadota bacterium]